MQDENNKPSEVLYVVLKAIVDVAVNAVKLVFQCLWFAGDRLVKMVAGSSGSDTENT